MQKRQLGNSDLWVNPFAFGGNVLGWTLDGNKAFEVLDALQAAGFNFIDTADVYSRWAHGTGGQSETLLGNWMKQRKNRQQLIIATKVGKDMGDGLTGLSKKNILNKVDASLKRLQTDYIDLYQSHDDDAATPLEETLDTYAQLIKAGKIRFIGASNYLASRLQEALAVSQRFSLPRYETLQPHYNLVERHLFEGALEEVCLEQHLGAIPYFSLASGFLTGKYRSQNDVSKSVRGDGALKYLHENGIRLLNALDTVAAAHKAKPASIALAWLMARPSVTAPIASATSVAQLHELLQATEITLNTKELELLNEVSSFSSRATV